MPPEVVKRETGSRIGDQRFLQIVLNTSERRAKLLGPDALTKMAPTTPEDEMPYQVDKMTDAELGARIVELMAKQANAVRGAVPPAGESFCRTSK